MAAVEDFEEALKRRQAGAWQGYLLRSSRGAPHDCVANGTTMLHGDPALANRLRFDELYGAPFCRNMPWDRGSDWREWTDLDDLELTRWAQLQNVPLRQGTVAGAVAIVSAQHRHHAVRDYLAALRWDGTKRLDSWLTTYFGVTGAPEPYLSAMSRAWPISAVARAHQAGCKADHTILIEGAQGIGKSSGISTLAGKDAWFADEVGDVGTKDAAQCLRGKWIIELSELGGLRRSDLEKVKAFMSRRIDSYRPSYGHRRQDFPRHCVFAGSTNADQPFNDETGNRRFWPVTAHKVDVTSLARDRDQLWAEAVVAYAAGESWWLVGAAEAQARGEQEDRRVQHPWEPVVMAWVANPKLKEPVTVGLILTNAIGKDQKDWSRGDEMAVSGILRANGYRRKRSPSPGGDGKRPWYYAKGA